VDKEAQKKMGNLIYETLKDNDLPIGNSAFIADIVSEALRGNGYRKLPEGKPPLLQPHNLAELKDNEWVNGRWYYNPYEIAQAQWNIWNEWYEAIKGQ